ncbi:MAG: right-handed parallel beta-helix repeat-containing protein [Prosthecobacter sp.]
MIPTPACDQALQKIALTMLVHLGISVSQSSAAEPRAIYEVSPAEGGAGINTAIAKLARSGGEIVLSAGTYQVVTPIIIRHNNITLRGAGPATKLKLAPKASCPVVVVGDEANEPRREVSGICVADLAIDGNREKQHGECWNGACDTGELTSIRSSGIAIRRARDILVLRVSADSCRSGGLVTEKGCRRVVVRDFSAKDNEFDGLACYKTEDSTFTRMVLSDNKSAGISTDLDFDHNSISHTRMERNGSHGIFMRNSSDNTFQDLVVQDSGRAGIFVDQVDLERRTGSVGNIFTSVNVTSSGGPAFQVNAASCKDTELTHAVFVNNPTGLWEKETGLVKMSDVEVKNRQGSGD